jgi:primosomal protein N'
MYLVTVLPLERKARASTLTYFTKEEILPGTTVSVPFRSGEMRALVIETKNASEAKSDLKNASFVARKINKVIGPSFLTPAFIRSAETLARYHLAPLSSVLAAFIPHDYLTYEQKFWTPHTEFTDRVSETVPDTLALQLPFDERISFYRTAIRESFARKQSIFLGVPTLHAAERFGRELSRGIAEYVIILSGDLSAKELAKKTELALKKDHAVLIIGTPQFAALPRNDYGTIIIEVEGSTTYRGVAHPHLDAHRFLEVWARESGLRVILADTILSLGTIAKVGDGTAHPIGTLTLRPHDSITEKIIPRTEVTKPKTGFQMVLTPVQEALVKTMEASKHTFLFGLRNGVATFTVCRDCGTTHTCEYCGIPLVLYETKTTRVFICNACKRESGSLATCRNCKSWNLIPLGIGIDGLYAEVSKTVPKEKLFRMDRTTVTTAKSGKKIIDAFLKTPGGVLIGTELAMPYLDFDSIETIGVVSFDSLFHVPSYRVGERIVRLLEDLRSRTKTELYIETGQPEHPLLGIKNRTTLADWHREELTERKQFGYPPYTTIIKVVSTGNQAQLTSEAKKLREEFSEWKPDIFPSWERGTAKAIKLTMILRVPEKEWSLKVRGGSFSETLEEALNILSNRAEITVDPENLL